ncbi:NAD(P)H-dependent oxidoreductase [Rhizobium sp. Rhizsp42]|uniref:NAD(P)H-dependent oxidoreductase n=1 Tax=Rhizobium sp. Rhizsp42 TaxID=3243034 RepID=UPI0039B08C41
MSRVLVLFAHPGQRHSKVNLAMAKAAGSVADITFADLYAEYPTFGINIDVEQGRLLAHDTIVFQFPLYWYSTPSLLKEWQDLVLEYGFAYGPSGDKLHGKKFLAVVTTGGRPAAYDPAVNQMHGLRSLLSPLQRSVEVCGMTFLPPFVLFGAIDAHTDGRAPLHTLAYRSLLEALRDDTIDTNAREHGEFLNYDLIPMNAGIEA